MSKHLLYYNPNIATHPNNHHLPGVARFAVFFKVFGPTAVFLDRTGTIDIPFHVKSLFPMPAFRPIAKSFEEICNERAQELLARAERLGATLHVFYSGGIDSTLVLVSLLKNATPEQKNHIVVLLSEESIAENPNFYRDHIHGKLRVDSAITFPYLLGSKHMFVGGEHNDQLFGSAIMSDLITRFGPEVLHRPYDRDLFFKFFDEKIGDPATTNFYLDQFERLKIAAPIDIASNFDVLWWINFSLKWQSVFMRMMSFATPRRVGSIDVEYIKTNYNHFYGTDDFQLWSMNNQDKKIKDSWKTYKWVCKDIIYAYTKDADYRDNKIKRGSLAALILQQNPYNFIDETMQFFYELDPREYYKPDNDFI